MQTRITATSTHRQETEVDHLKVVLIEDSADDALLMQQLIEHGGFHVTLHIINDGQMALDYFRDRVDAWAPSDIANVVFLDLSLPKVSGLDILRAMKADGRLADIPVIILSDTTEDLHFWRGQKLRAHTHIAKPMTLYEFTWIANSIAGYWRRIGRLKTKDSS